MATKTIEMNVKDANGGYTALHPKTIAEYVNYNGVIDTKNLKIAMDTSETAVGAVVANMASASSKETNMVILKENVSVSTSAWTSSSTYTDFPFKADISITGCTDEHIPDVYFSLADASSGIFSPIVSATSGKITIWATEKPTKTITIPTIKLVSGVRGSQEVKFLSGIYVSTPPNKTSYKVGETLNLTGMVVKAVFTNSTEQVINTYNTSPERGTVLDDDTTEVLISYTYDGITKTTTQPLSVSPALPTDKTFNQLTDAELRQIIEALDAGTITTSNLNWKAGDSRSVSLGSFQTYSSSTSSTSTQAAQTAQLVILNVGGKTFRGNGTSLDGQTCHYVVGFKDNVCKSYWGDEDNTYSSSLIKTVENNVYNALPTDVKTCFKKFDVITGTYSSSSTSGGTNTTSQQYFTSPAEKEIFGYRTYSTTKEANALSQFTYYTTENNRKHSNLMSFWWERSPSYDNSLDACCVSSDGTANANSYVDGYTYGVSPFGCM